MKKLEDKKLDAEGTCQGLIKIANNCLTSSVREMSRGNEMRAGIFLGNAATMILRAEWYARKINKEEEYLRSLKDKYFEVSRQLGVNLQ